ncbi:MAG: hypothetical protein EHM21_13245 [Chloroflexi bacterium]|nr:MAG: hypothetical protein EHM21_13245 [Chloroflexota bacterium]
MNLYTHYHLARRLEWLLRPDDPADYAWGAVIPDIRYLAGMPRSQTHVAIAEVKSWLECFPALRSFTQGYLVHCLLDQIDVAGTLETSFPMPLLQKITRRKLSQTQATMLVEYYYLRDARENCARQDGASPAAVISGKHNAILAELGIRPEQTEDYAWALKEYLAVPTLENAVRLARRLGLVDDSRFEKYLGAAQSLQKNRLLLLPMMWSVRNGQFERRGKRLIRSYG